MESIIPASVDSARLYQSWFPDLMIKIWESLDNLLELFLYIESWKALPAGISAQKQLFYGNPGITIGLEVLASPNNDQQFFL